MPSGNSVGFGVPPPLPGEKARKHHVSLHSEKLEVEASRMAERLGLLRVQLHSEKERREMTSKERVGGATWRSSRVDRTSVIRGYAKEVQKQHLMRKTAQQLQQKAAIMPGGGVRDRTNSKAFSAPLPGGGKPSVVDPTTASRSQLPGRSNSAKAAATNISSNNKMMTTAAAWEKVSPAPTSAIARNLGMRSIRGPDTRAWSVGDTLGWLGEDLALPQYQECFAKNEISGPVLLEIGLDDLDYMGITVLGHRKTILKAVEDLKRERPSSSASTMLSTGRRGINSREQRRRNNNNEEEELIHQQQKGEKEVMLVPCVHQTIKRAKDDASEHNNDRHQRPEGSSSKRKDRPSSHQRGTSFSEGEYDEEEARASFQEALMEWRNTGKKAISSSSSDAAASKVGTPGTSTKVAIEREAQAAGAAGRTVSNNQEMTPVQEDEDDALLYDDGMWWNPCASTPPSYHRAEAKGDAETCSSLPSSSRSSSNSSRRCASGSKNSLRDGELDEKAEHKAFAAAVEEWRRGKRTSSSSSSASSSRDGSSSSAGSVRLEYRNGSNGRRVIDAKAFAKTLASKMDQEHEKTREDLARHKADFMAKIADVQQEVKAASTKLFNQRVLHDRVSSPDEQGDEILFSCISDDAYYTKEEVLSVPRPSSSSGQQGGEQASEVHGNSLSVQMLEAIMGTPRNDFFSYEGGRVEEEERIDIKEDGDDDYDVVIEEPLEDE